jgi:3,4-dihydroxy 2-butanone 4-phosphate synthase/GTP cyclohydrolase II
VRLPESLETTLTGMEGCYQKTGRPWVTLAFAQSIDGSIAARRGVPLALSNAASLEITHLLRARHDAILVGIGTLLADDPQLNVRLVPGDNPQPVVLDNRLRFPPDARLLKMDSTPWIMTSRQSSSQRAEALTLSGARIFRPSPGRLRLRDVLDVLGQEGIHSVMVEGGARIITAFLQAELVNQIVITISPLLVGGLRAIELPLRRKQVTPLQPNRYPRLGDPDVLQLGDDLLIWGTPTWLSRED